MRIQASSTERDIGIVQATGRKIKRNHRMVQKTVQLEVRTHMQPVLPDQKLYVRQILVSGIMVRYCVLLKFQFAYKSRLWDVANSTSNCTKTHHFGMKISKIFWRGGIAPSPDPSPGGEGDTPSPHPTPIGACGASILAPSALGVPTLLFLQINHWVKWKSVESAFSLRFNGHFPGKPGFALAGVYWTKGWWNWWWQLEL